MRGQFEVENSQYPVAALPNGEGKYYVTNMIGLDKLSELPFRQEEAVRLASSINSLHRASRNHGWRGHGLSPEVLGAAKLAIEEHFSATDSKAAVL